MENFSQGAEWTTRYKNNLPDSAFLYIEAGGKKDSEGKIKPRSLRHFPYKDADGKVDRAHILNAIARIPQAKFLSRVQKDRMQARARGIYLKFVKYNSKKANSFDLLLNKLAAAVHAQPSVSKAMGEWYEDLSFYNPESMKIDEIIKDISVIIKESECLKKCLESETFLLGTWEETLKTSVLDSLFLLQPNNNAQPNNLEISALTHAQIINWLKENCTGCFNNLQPSMAKKMDRWYEDPNFYAAENISMVSKAVDIISGLLGKCEIQCLNDLRIFNPSWRESLAKYLENYLQNPKNKTKFEGKTEIQKVTVLVMAGFEWVKSYCGHCFTRPQLDNFPRPPFLL